MHSDDTSNKVRVRGLLSATIHEAGCGLNKSLNEVCICVSCNKVKNLLYL
jgi:hypothetical protein